MSGSDRYIVAAHCVGLDSRFARLWFQSTQDGLWSPEQTRFASTVAIPDQLAGRHIGKLACVRVPKSAEINHETIQSWIVDASRDSFKDLGSGVSSHLDPGIWINGVISDVGHFGNPHHYHLMVTHTDAERSFFPVANLAVNMHLHNIPKYYQVLAMIGMHIKRSSYGLFCGSTKIATMKEGKSIKFLDEFAQILCDGNLFQRDGLII